ncbi:DNA translocase FtsK 4TM domain-containing protein [Moraxella nasovis]|uniref:DNA translocase FtsK n=1 Tax=Moraxella nasovis TaxID=2904121 RepID=UPI001F607668|nr:DNA translocase FtsK [Moraxella nasovis]UNU73973.1 DNA translocase FtsK 4TM domain-containing protein [Moraxella nasovis]
MKHTINKILQHEHAVQLLGKLPSITQFIFSAFGLLLFGFLFISLLSYSPVDPAWSHVSTDQAVVNVGGVLGAWVADILRVFFGLGSWCFVLFLAYELVRLWWTGTSVFWGLRLLAYAFLLCFISALLAQMGVTADLWSGILLGGLVGFEIQSGLASVFGAFGTAVFLVVMTLFVATLTFEIRWLTIYERLLNWRRKSKSDDQAFDEVVLEDVQDTQDEQDKTLSEESATSNYRPHNHAGTLESFLVNSGLREDLIAKKHSATNEPNVTAKPKVAEVNNSPKDEAWEEDMPVSAPHYDDVATSLQAQLQADDERFAKIAQAALSKLSDDGEEVDKAVFDGMDFDQLSTYQDDTAKSLSSTDEPTDTVSEDKTHQDDDVKEKFFGGFDDIGSFQGDTENQNSNQDGNQNEDETQLVQHLAMPIEPKAQTNEDLFAPVEAKSRAMSTLEYRMSLPPVPTLDILDKPDLNKEPSYNDQQLQELASLLEIKLKEFNINATVVAATVGPVVTRFEVDLAPGVRVARVNNVAQDLARSLSMEKLRVVDVIAGKPYIGIEVPNKKRELVRFIELLDNADFKNGKREIAIAIGKNIHGEPVISDLTKAPHMLVAGQTRSGKSVFVNSMLLSMLLKYTSDELKLMLIDPKLLELANYSDIPHLLTPVITDMTEATAALNWCVNEMELRYQLMGKLRVRQISEFNKAIKAAEQSGEPILDPLWRKEDSVSVQSAPKLKPLPYIVIVMDEFADMIMQLGKTAEEPIVRLAQKARAAGIHLILATQKPIATVVTGLIKANLPCRVALSVYSKMDSRVILDESGAEDLLGNGDMLFVAPNENTPERIQGAFVSDDEVNRVCDAWRERGRPEYIDLSSSYTFEGEGSGDSNTAGDDELFDQALEFILETRKISISAIQRKFSIGYNRSARIVDMMEEKGLVSAADSSGRRQLLM